MDTRRKKIILFIATSLAIACMFFAARVLVSFLGEDERNYKSYAVWALLMGIISTAFDRPIKKWLEGKEK